MQLVLNAIRMQLNLNAIRKNTNYQILKLKNIKNIVEKTVMWNKCKIEKFNSFISFSSMKTVSLIGEEWIEFTF